MRLNVSALAIVLLPLSQAQLRGSEGVMLNQQQVPVDFAQQQQHLQRAVFEQQHVAQQHQAQVSGESQRQATPQNLYQGNREGYAYRQDGGQVQTTSQAQHLVSSADPQQQGFATHPSLDRQMQGQEQLPRDPVAHERRFQQVQQFVPPEQLISIFPGGGADRVTSGSGKMVLESPQQMQQAPRLEQQIEQQTNPLMTSRETIPVRRAEEGTASPATTAPITAPPITASPTTASPTTASPVTASPTTANPSAGPTPAPTTATPSQAPSTATPSQAPTTAEPSAAPVTENPTRTAFLPSGANAYGNDHYQTGPWHECIGWEANDCQQYIESITSDSPKIHIEESGGTGQFSKNMHRVRVFTSVDGLVIRKPERG